MLERDRRFLRLRIHWGLHLPSDIVDGLRRIENNTFVDLSPQDTKTLLEELLVLETGRTKEGKHLYAEIPSDNAKLITSLSSIKLIVSQACGWI